MCYHDIKDMVIYTQGLLKAGIYALMQEFTIFLDNVQLFHSRT